MEDKPETSVLDVRKFGAYKAVFEDFDAFYIISRYIRKNSVIHPEPEHIKTVL